MTNFPLKIPASLNSATVQDAIRFIKAVRPGCCLAIMADMKNAFRVILRRSQGFTLLYSGGGYTIVTGGACQWDVEAHGKLLKPFSRQLNGVHFVSFPFIRWWEI